MKILKRKALNSVMAFIVVAAACNLSIAQDNKYNEIASFIIQHNAALEAEVIFGDDNSKALKDDEILSKALAHKQNWRDIYRNHILLARVVGEHTVILMCSRNGKRALLEDSSCTPTFDKYRFKENTPCEISFTQENICSTDSN